MIKIDIKGLTGESLIQFLKQKISTYETSEEYKRKKEGRDYYIGNQEINNKKRLGRSDKGRVVELIGLPNVVIKDNQYAKLLDQKRNYILSDTPVIKCEQEDYAMALQEFMDLRFMRTWSKISKDAFNCGIGWMYLYTDGQELKYKKVDALDIIPIWADSEHESLDGVIRKNSSSEWDSNQNKAVTKYFVEFYTEQGVTIYQCDNDKWVEISRTGYLSNEQGQFNWGGKIPFIYWRYSSDETTLLQRVKTIQDMINLILSVFGDRMLEDSRNTILVIKGYDGEDPNEIRYEINQSGVIQVQDDGAVNTLDIEINANNFKMYLDILKDKLLENGRGFDAKSDKLGNSPNQLNIKSAYSDMELDANEIELEFQASFEHFQWFFKKVYGFKENLMAQMQFKRNIMVNEQSTVDMINQSSGLLSTQTLLEHHPYVDSVQDEISRIREDELSVLSDYSNGFSFNHKLDGDEGEE